jgi:PAS domain S-box-containing protein
MGPIIIADIVVGSICFTIALLHLIIYLRRPDSKAEFFFALMCFCAAGNAFSEIWAFRAVTLNLFNSAYKTQITFQGILWISLAWFIFYYTGTTRRWLAFTVTATYALATLINVISPYGVLYLRIDELYQATLPWGERIAFANGPANPWRYVADIGWIILMYMAVESCVRMRRRGDRRRAILLGVSLLVFLGLTYLHGTLMDFGVVGPPSLFSFTFLGLVLVMSTSLTGEVVKASVLRREVETSEQRWRLLLENANLLAVGIDHDGCIDYVNPHFLKVSGYSSDEVIGMPVIDFVPENDREDLRDRFIKAMEGVVRPRTEISLLTKDGSRRSIRWFNILLRDRDGKTTGALSIGEDISDRKQAEQKLRDERERMDVILSTLNTGLALINPDLTVAWVNAQTQSILPWDELIGKLCYEAAAKRKEPCEGCGAIKAFTDGQIHETVRQSPVDGSWHHIVSIPIKDEKGSVVNVLESVTDITELKQTELDRDRVMKELEALKDQLEEENIYLKSEIREVQLFSGIIGKSNALHYILTRVKQVAKTNATALVQGETGVGKELVSRAIHESSNRSDKPFIKVNCAALPMDLIESELFGHERGAFTDAHQQRKGRFELADGGTLFLDEISEMPLKTQAKLLRVLQDGEFERVGGSQTLKMDVRVIAATNQDLNKEIADGRFRPDLYYRLNVYPISVPPLRKRREDIPLLVEHFIPQMASRIGKHIDQVPVQVMEQLMAYDWPGNVRELENVLERAVITSTDFVLRLITELAAPADTQLQNAAQHNSQVPLDEVERRHILAVLKSTHWRISGPDGAAKILGLNPSTLRFRMKKHGIARKN